MVEHLGTGDAAERAFGLAISHKAIAHAELKQYDDARWYFSAT